jgi:hypothetical protein
MSPAKNLNLKELTLKLVMLMALVSAQRGQTLHSLRTDKMTLHKSYALFEISNVLKTTRPGTGTPTLKFKAYAPDRRLCVLTYLNEYKRRTRKLRKNTKQLFISYRKPHAKISRATISRWIKTVMAKSGINTEKFKPHSVRAAATSAAKRAQIPIEDIMKTAGWAGCRTFAQYYDKPIAKTADFAAAVLDN